VSSAIGSRGCFPTGRHYPGIAHLIRISGEGLSSEWDATTPILDIPWIAIDTETTGREPGEHRIVELGCVLFERGVVTARHSWLINPERPIPEESMAVHGITDADVADKPTFSAIATEVAVVLGRGVPLAYNAEFDRAFLLAEFERLPQPELLPILRPTVWLDPLSWARELQKEHKSRALGEVCERLGINLERAHRATDDAEAAGQVLAAFLRDQRVPARYGAFIKEQKRLERLFEFERVRWR
jgi:DNA polymerase III subunit epsilon